MGESGQTIDDKGFIAKILAGECREEVEALIRDRPDVAGRLLRTLATMLFEAIEKRGAHADAIRRIEEENRRLRERISELRAENAELDRELEKLRRIKGSSSDHTGNERETLK